MKRYIRLIVIVIVIAAVTILTARCAYDTGFWIGSN